MARYELLNTISVPILPRYHFGSPWTSCSVLQTCGDVVIRHNRLRNIFTEFCRRAHLSVRVEVVQAFQESTAILVQLRFLLMHGKGQNQQLSMSQLCLHLLLPLCIMCVLQLVLQPTQLSARNTPPMTQSGRR